MKLWLDDERPAPAGYIWIKTTNMAQFFCLSLLDSKNQLNIQEISLDHDAGDYEYCGGDYIQLLNWLERKEHEDNWDLSQVQFHLHTTNPVESPNMRAIIQKNSWKETI